MIVLKSLTCAYGLGVYRRTILDDIDAIIPSQAHYVIFGNRDSGKSTLIRLLSGLHKPTRGWIERHCRVSLPVGANDILFGRLVDTPRQVASFFARLYGAEPRSITDFIAEFADLTELMDTPLEYLRRLEQGRFAVALAYAIPADFYLFDGKVSIGLGDFTRRCEQAFAARQETAGTIIVRGTTRDAKKYGDRGGVLSEGKLFLFDNIEEAIDTYAELSSEKVSDDISMAERLVREGHISQAQAHLKKYLTKNGEDVSAYKLLASLLFREGSYEAAIAVSQTAIERVPSFKEPHLLLARIAEREKRFEDANYHAAEFLEFDPDNRDALIILARSHDALKQHTEAAVAWRQMSQEGSNNLNLRLAINSEIKAQNFSRALTDIEAALELSGHDISLYELRIQVLSELGDLKALREAIAELAMMDVSKALANIVTLRKILHWKEIVFLLGGLEQHDLQGETKILAIILSYLRHQAVLATRQAREADAQELYDAIARLGLFGSGGEDQERGLSP